MASSDSAALLAAGNTLQRDGRHAEALLEFERVGRLLPTGDPAQAPVLASMAEALLALRRPQDAVGRCKEALVLNPSFPEARAQLVVALLALGSFVEARAALNDDCITATASQKLQEVCRQLQASEDTLSRGDEALAAGDFNEALSCFTRLEKGDVFAAPALDKRLAQCHLGLNDFQNVLMYSRRILRSDETSVVARLLQAEVIFSSNKEALDSDLWVLEAEKAVKMAKQALALDPEHKEAISLLKRLRACIKDVAAVRAVSEDGQKAEELLTRLINSASGGAKFKARLLAERGRIHFERKDWERCIADCSAACSLDDRLASAHVHWAQALQHIDKHDEAVEVFERLHTWKKDEDTFWKVEWAKFEVRKKNRPDYYGVLGANADAKDSEIKRRYLLACQEYHPDKTSKLEATERGQAEEKFKLIQEAYECLSNPAKRELFDKGYDIQGIREVLQVRKRYAGQAPCAQCGEDESGKLGSDGKWYCQVCWDGFYRMNPDDPLAKDHLKPNGDSVTSTAPSSADVPRERNSPSSPSHGPVEFEGPIPSKEQIGNMGVAELKEMLVTLRSGSTGCLTKEDMRERIYELLTRVRTREDLQNPDTAEKAPAPPPSPPPPPSHPSPPSPPAHPPSPPAPPAAEKYAQDPFIADSLKSSSVRPSAAPDAPQVKSATAASPMSRTVPESWAGAWSVPTPGLVPGGASGGYQTSVQQSHQHLSQAPPLKFDIVDDLPEEGIDHQFEAID